MRSIKQPTAPYKTFSPPNFSNGGLIFAMMTDSPMKYTEATLHISQLPHVTNVKWHNGCIFIFVDFFPINSEHDPAPYPTLDKAVLTKLEAVSDDEPRYRARGYVDPAGTLFGVVHLTGTSMEEIQDLLKRVTDA